MRWLASEVGDPRTEGSWGGAEGNPDGGRTEPGGRAAYSGATARTNSKTTQEPTGQTDKPRVRSTGKGFPADTIQGENHSGIYN